MVSFGGPVADILTAANNYLFGDIFRAQMHENVIYLWKTWGLGQTSRSSDPLMYSRLNLLHLTTDRRVDEINSEYDKYFAINLIEYESHRLLTLSEVDAIDDNESIFGINTSRLIRSAKDQQFFSQNKLLRVWSKAVIQGSDRCLIANTSNDNILADIQVYKVSDILESTANYWSHIVSIDFLNRFLTFVKNTVINDKNIYEFVFNRGRKYVLNVLIRSEHRLLSLIGRPFLSLMFKSSL